MNIQCKTSRRGNLRSVSQLKHQIKSQAPFQKPLKGDQRQMTTKKDKARTSLDIITFYSSSQVGPFYLSCGTEADCVHFPNPPEAALVQA